MADLISARTQSFRTTLDHSESRAGKPGGRTTLTLIRRFHAGLPETHDALRVKKESSGASLQRRQGAFPRADARGAPGLSGPAANTDRSSYRPLDPRMPTVRYLPRRYFRAAHRSKFSEMLRFRAMPLSWA